MALTLTPVATYAPGANENPVNPALWTTPASHSALRWVATGTGSPYLRASSTASPSAGIYTGTSFSNDQYAKATLKAFTSGNGQDWSMYLRSDNNLQNAYQANFVDNGGTSLFWSLFKFKNGYQTLLSEGTITYVAGDIFTFAVVGTVLYIYQNATLLTKLDDQQLPITSGNPGLGIDALVSSASDVRLNTIIFGNTSGSDNTGTHTLSGNVGIAGAAVAAVGHVLSYFPIMIADGSGNYSAAGFPDDTYTVVPIADGYTFTPLPATVVISGANNTLNLTPVATTITLTPQFSDTFLYGDTNPLPSPWTQPDAGIFTAPLQSVSHLAQTVTPGDFGGARYNGSALPNNQYASVKIAAIAALPAVPVLQCCVRENAAMSSGYDIFLTVSGNGYVSITVEATAAIYVTANFIPYAANDVFTIAVVGTTVYALRNGVVVVYASFSASSSGFAGIALGSSTANADIEASSFAVGAAALGGGAVGWSPVDARASHTFPTLPNTGVVQSDGSVFYTGQTSSNSTLPPTDSRAAGAPVDSRASKPVNSRINPNA